MAREAFKNTCKDSDLIDISWGPKHSIFYKPSWGTYYVAIFENHWPGYINYTLEFTKTYRYYRWRTEEVSETGVVIFKNSENVDSRNYRPTNLTLFLNILWNKCSLSTYEKRKVMTAWKQHRFPKDKLWKTHRVGVCVCVCVGVCIIILVSKYLDFSKTFDKMLYNIFSQWVFFFFFWCKLQSYGFSLRHCRSLSTAASTLRQIREAGPLIPPPLEPEQFCFYRYLFIWTHFIWVKFYC